MANYSGKEKVSLDNIKSIFSEAQLLKELRGRMGLGYDLGPLQIENGGTGKTSTDRPYPDGVILLTGSGSSNILLRDSQYATHREEGSGKTNTNFSLESYGNDGTISVAANKITLTRPGFYVLQFGIEFYVNPATAPASSRLEYSFSSTVSFGADLMESNKTANKAPETLDLSWSGSSSVWQSTARKNKEVNFYKIGKANSTITLDSPWSWSYGGGSLASGNNKPRGYPKTYVTLTYSAYDGDDA